MNKIIALPLFFLLCACSNNQLIEKDYIYSETAYLQIGINKLEDQGDAYQAGMSLKNTSDLDLLVFIHDFACLKKETYGIFQLPSDPERNHRALLIRAKEELNFPIACELSASENQKMYSIRLSKVYDNPTGDGRTLGQNLAQNLEWSFQSPN